MIDLVLTKKNVNNGAWLLTDGFLASKFLMYYIITLYLWLILFFLFAEKILVLTTCQMPMGDWR